MKQRSVYLTWSGLILPLGALAAPPVNYDQWSVTSGTVDTSLSCSAAGVTCETLSSDDGFLQEQVNTPDYSYIRVIVTDSGASGDPTNLNFASESFVPFAFVNAGTTQGVAAQQILRDPAQGLTDITQIQSAHMRFNNPAAGVSGDSTPAADRWNVNINQTFDTAEMTSSFSYKDYTQFNTGPANTPDTSQVIGYKMDIAQSVLTGAPGDTSQKQSFVQRERSGYQGNSIGDPDFGGAYFVSEPLVTASTAPITLNGTDITWQDAETIKTTWIAQSSGVTAGTVGFAYERAENVDAGTVADQFALDIPEPANPFDWDSTNFGSAPTFP